MLGLVGRGRAWIAILVIVTVALLVGAVACNDSSSGGIVPTTGILIRAETLTTGKGCGAGPTQVFKYVVVVFRYTGGNPESRGSYTTFQASNVFDCYVDGEFVSLPTNVGNQIYRLEVYAFNKDTYVQSQAGIEAAVRSTNDTDPSNDQASSEPFKTALPTWTTECTATQNNEVETLAQCDPLSPGLGGVDDGTVKPTQITLATESFRLPDGRLGVCAPGTVPAPEAGADADAGDEDASFDDAGDDDAGDASSGDDASTEDASTDADAGPDASTSDAGPLAIPFTTVRVRLRIGSQIEKDPVDLPCGSPFVAEVSPEPASYTVDVGLIDATGTPLGQTACAVTTTTGAVNVAACP